MSGMPLYQLGSKKPKVHPTSIVAPNASIIGDVVIGPQTSIWPGAVLRGDYGKIRVGANCSLQDNVVVHCSSENAGIIGDGVTVAHSAIVHACRIGDECLIGAGSIIFDGARIGTHSIIGVGTVLLEGRTITPRSVAVGAPAMVMRRASDMDVRMIRGSYRAYVKMAQKYASTGAFETRIG